MKILQIAPIWESVPPRAYGGTEAVVSLLCDELVRQGHEVTLWASGDSRTAAELRSCVRQAVRSVSALTDKLPYVYQHSALAIADANEFDIVHNHSGEEVMALAVMAPDVPMLTTTHCNITPDRRFIWDHYDGFFNTISLSQQRRWPAVIRPQFAGVAYNGIDVESFPFQAEKEDFLLFLSRISPEKGTHIAIEVAKRAGRKLVIAGKVDAVDREYYANYVEPLIDGDRVVMVGEADATFKRELYRKADAVLMPIVWEEPFGLVLAEAAACGTPVIVFGRGAAAEIVQDRATGFVVKTTDDMVEAVGRIGEISPWECRRWIQEQFGKERMASRYVEIYGDILSQSHVRTEPAAEVSWIGLNRNSELEQVAADRVA